jgi:hypothetical protein
MHPGYGGPRLHQGLQAAVLRRRATGGFEPGTRAGEPVPQRGRRGGPRRPGPVDHDRMAGGGDQGCCHAGERRRRRAERRARTGRGRNAAWLARGRCGAPVALAARRVGRLLPVRGGAVAGRPPHGEWRRLEAKTPQHGSKSACRLAQKPRESQDTESTGRPSLSPQASVGGGLKSIQG